MAKTNPFVSVVVVTFNNGNYLADTISSVLKQTYSNLELIIWDDGSTDNTREIVNSYDDKRIRYFYNENQGIGKATMMACDQAKGDLIARLDGDDIWLPTKLEKQISYLEHHPSVIALGTAMYIINEKGERISRNFPSTSHKTLYNQIQKFRNPFLHSSLIFYRKSYIESGGYLPIKSRLDALIVKQLSETGEIANLSEPLTLYRVYDKSITTLNQCGAYKAILGKLYEKIANDPTHRNTDIPLYNAIYDMNRKQVDHTAQLNKKRLSIDFQYKLYTIISKLIGEKSSTKIIYLLKRIIQTKV